MIIIELSTPIKLSGRDSLKIKFNYSEELVELVKVFSPAIWHKNLGIWEVGENYLHAVLDKFCFYDDIALIIKQAEIREISSELKEEEINNFKYKPFAHQIEGINFLISNKKSLLLDGMGVGKSLQLMYMAETLYNRGEIDHCLVICGVDSLRSNWKSEIQKFSKLPVIVLGERTTRTGKTVYDNIPARVKQLQNKIEEFFVVVNISTIRNDSIIKAISTGPNNFGLIAVDEIHRVATKTSQQGANLLKLKSNYKVAMTGTPITNSPLSVYVPLSWTENDHATLTNYKGQYCKFGGFNNSQIVGSQNLDLLQDELDQCSIRRTLSMIKSDIPLKTVEYELVEMSDEHAKFYEAIKQGIKEEADKINLNANNILALTTRLRQATSSPSTLTTQEILSSKIERCVELAEELLLQKEKVLILCNFIDSANCLNKLLSTYKPILCTGQQSDDIISRGVEAFRNSGDFNLLIGTHSKMGTGISLPECHYAIFLDTPFTSAQLKQSEDRIYRITSTQPVFIKILMCKDTYDERVKEIVDNKQELSDYLVDGQMSPKYMEMLRQSLLDL